MDKINNLRNLLIDNDVDAVLIEDLANVFYYSNFSGTSAKLLICADSQYLITDFRYQQQATSSSPDFEVLIESKDNNLYEIINKLRRKHKINLLALEGDYVSRNNWLLYEKNLTPRLTSLNIDVIREIKTEAEIEIIKESIKIAEEAFNYILDEIKIGVSEKSLALKLEYKMLELGASDIAFDTIVASGKRGALPHGVASDKLIEDNELITFDFGCIYKGYCSDITRTVAVGQVESELIDIYNIVLEANLIGINALKEYRSGYEVDKLVRDFIDNTKYKGLFGHGLGHSIGVKIHEDPRLRNDVDHKLNIGNVITVEPGIYVEGLGGVRIEDDVLITNDGIEILTSLNKELIVLEGR